MIQAYAPLLLLIFTLGVVIFYNRAQRQHTSQIEIRESFLFATIIVGLVITISTEILSLSQAISHVSIGLIWCFLAALIFLINARYGAFVDGFFDKFKSLQLIERIVLYVIIFYVGIVGFIAFYTPPNSYDAMIYHLGRVMHWVQNQSVEFYPTAIPRQLWANPLANFIQLHIYLLSQSDRWINLIQWCAMLISALGISRILKIFHVPRFGQIVGALLVVSMPLGILQASAPLNDYVLAMWMIIFVYFLWRWEQQQRLLYLLAASVALGLGCFTKNTMFIFAFPFIASVMILLFRNKRYQQILLASCVFIIAILAINGTHYARNLQYGGHMLMPGAEPITLINEKFTFQTLISNSLRSLSTQLGSTAVFPLDRLIYDFVENVHDIWGWDVNDPAISYVPFPKSRYGEHILPFHEIYAGNAIHTMFFLLSFFILIFFRNKFKDLPIFYFIAALVLGWLLFILIIKWQIWQTRLLLPLSLLSIVVIVYTFFKAFVIRRQLLVLLTIILCLVSWQWLFFNQHRPLIGKKTIFDLPRSKDYFAYLTSFMPPFQKTLNKINTYSCANIGLRIGWDSWEYPWHIFIKKERLNVRIEHVNVENNSRLLRYPLGEFNPCLIVSEQDYGDIWERNTHVFTKQLSTRYFYLYQLEDKGNTQ